MNKRAILAVVLSSVVLISWQVFLAKKYPVPVDTKEVTQIKSEKADNLSTTEPLPPKPQIKKDTILYPIENQKVKIDWTDSGARLTKLYLKDYNLTSHLQDGLYNKVFENEIYTLQKSDGKFIFNSQKQNGHYISKILNFRNSNHYIELEIIYGNEDSNVWNFDDKLILGSVPINSNSLEGKMFEVVFLGTPIVRKNPLGIKNKFVFSGNTSTNRLALRDRYSCAIIKAQEDSQGTALYIEKNQIKNMVEIGLELKRIIVPAHSSLRHTYVVYLGPQEINFLKEKELGFEEVVHYGTFDFISHFLLSLLRFIYRLVHNWGAALILLTLLIFFALYPLTLKQLHSMKEMQQLQPQVEALRKNYKDNPQRLNKELMELYRKHKVNPLGGCLPMVMQIPVFFGLYQALSRSIVLKNSRFLWIKDLAEPDRLITLPWQLPVVGNELNILPILMAVAMFFQQRLSLRSASVSSEYAQQQKIMANLFPVMFGFIFYHVPSGLTIYWFLNTLLSVLSQWRTLKVASAENSKKSLTK